MTGVVNGVQMSAGLLLIRGIMIEIPIAMMLLARILPGKVNSRANLIVGAISIVFMAINLNAPGLDDKFFALYDVENNRSSIFIHQCRARQSISG